MSFDLIFVSRTGLSPTTVVEAVGRWAKQNPHLKFDANENGGEVVYENPDTLVHALFTLAFEHDAEALPAAPGFRDTGCAAAFNFLRPAFFADELTPLAVSLAEAIPALIYDPQDDTVLEPQAFAQAGAYRRHLAKINFRFLHDQDKDKRPRAVDGALLDAFWRHNSTKADLQTKLGASIFVPTMMLMDVNGQPDPTTVFTWVRAIPTAMHQAGLVLLSRERRQWFGGTKRDYHLAPFDKFRRSTEALLSEIQGEQNVFLLHGSVRNMERAFDALAASLPTVTDLKTILPSRLGNLMGIVDRVSS